MKFNKKGQGALEYLLLIGGAVLIAVIVIALLVGMGSENATTARERNTEALEAIDTPIPSTISNVTCTGDNSAIISWTPVFKDGYTYSVSENGLTISDALFDSTVNPFVGGTNCTEGTIYIITTKVGDKTVTSNSFRIN
jgi:uncharacterized protein (UPF0333 family)